MHTHRWHWLKPLRPVIFAMGQRPHRMSSLQQPLDRVTARGTRNFF
jgi:hypothetical protein